MSYVVSDHCITLCCFKLKCSNAPEVFQLLQFASVSIQVPNYYGPQAFEVGYLKVLSVVIGSGYLAHTNGSSLIICKSNPNSGVLLRHIYRSLNKNIYDFHGLCNCVS